MTDIDKTEEKDALHEEKVIRGERANWIGYVVPQGILWVNYITSEEKLEVYD